MSLQSTMRSAVYRGAGRIVVERVPVPLPGPGEALLQVDACGICPTDIKKIRDGRLAPPLVFGHEIAATVVETRPELANVRIGDRFVVLHHVPCHQCFYCQNGLFAQCPSYKATGSVAAFAPAGGGLSEYVLALSSVATNGLIPIPDHVESDQATFVEPVNTVLKGICRSNIAAGGSAIVLGQGPIGLLFTRILALRGIRVAGVDPIRDRLLVASAMGAASVHVDLTDAAATTAAATDGRGADAVVIAADAPSTVNPALSAVRPGGSVLLFASTRLNDEAAVDVGAVCVGDKRLIGSYSSDHALYGEAASLVFGGSLILDRLISHVCSLDDIASAIDVAANPGPATLKVIVKP